MTTTKRTHSIHIDAPVKKVFHYLEEPGHLMSGMGEASDGTPPTVVAVHRTPKGVVTSYECKYRELGMHLTATITREECVDNEAHRRAFLHGSRLDVLLRARRHRNDTDGRLGRLHPDEDARRGLLPRTRTWRSRWPPSSARSRPWPESAPPRAKRGSGYGDPL